MLCWKGANRPRLCMQIKRPVKGLFVRAQGAPESQGPALLSLPRLKAFTDPHTHRKQQTPGFPSTHPGLFSSLSWRSGSLYPVTFFSVCLGFCLVAMFALSRHILFVLFSVCVHGMRFAACVFFSHCHGVPSGNAPPR